MQPPTQGWGLLETVAWTRGGEGDLECNLHPCNLCMPGRCVEDGATGTQSWHPRALQLQSSSPVHGGDPWARQDPRRPQGWKGGPSRSALPVGQDPAQVPSVGHLLLSKPLLCPSGDHCLPVESGPCERPQARCTTGPLTAPHTRTLHTLEGLPQRSPTPRSQLFSGSPLKHGCTLTSPLGHKLRHVGA